MTDTFGKIRNNKTLIMLIKVLACLLVFAAVFKLHFMSGTERFYDYVDYKAVNENSDGEIYELSRFNKSAQAFVASGNHLNYVTFYYGRSDDKNVDIELTDENGVKLSSAGINTKYLDEDSWNRIKLEADITKGNTYILSISSADGLSGFYFDNEKDLTVEDILYPDIIEAPDETKIKNGEILSEEIKEPVTFTFDSIDEENAFNTLVAEGRQGADVTDALKVFLASNIDGANCFITFYVDGMGENGKMLAGICQTYSYISASAISEYAVTSVFILFICALLCFAICRFDDLYEAFTKKGKKGFAYALYFSLYLMLSFSPLNGSASEVTEFKRVFGEAFNRNVDISKRLNSFNLWFIAFAVVFVLLFMLANYLLGKVKNEDQKKCVIFLDSFMVLADCLLLFRSITFFSDTSNDSSVYVFSQYMLMLIAASAVCYLLFSFERFVAPGKFMQLMVCCSGLAVLITVLTNTDLGSGRIYIGVLTILTVLIFVSTRIVGNSSDSKVFTSALNVCTVFLSAVPLLTSVYIELVHILHRNGIYVAHPAKYYAIAGVLGLAVTVFLAVISIKKKFEISDWKRFSFPVLAAGVTGLSIQIPLVSLYAPHIFESANTSILLSGFLNYGEIPLVEHYGGHMMTGVWEGLIYAFLNNDPAGIVSPYKNLLYVVLALVFYYFIAKIRNRETALLSVLFLPFVDVFSYYGLGILVCLAAMSYVKKNTFARAFAIWLAFVWCALYRLDLGFAFGLAVIVALLIYVVSTKNKTAAKQLGISLAITGVVGLSAWFILCASRGISPVNRLKEFIALSMSNQNWSINNMGSVDKMSFAIGYLIVPFIMVITLLFTVFSKSFRKKIGDGKWVMMIILNVSYFQNFSRGVVRHSLRTDSTDHVFWCAFLFLALFIAFNLDKMKLFIPSYLALIVFTSLIISPANYRPYVIADNAASSPEAIIERWYPAKITNECKTDPLTTVWENYKYVKRPFDRVVLDDGTRSYSDKFKPVLDTLLEDNETYADFINRTMLYPIMGYRCPVYVSQSPLQLSGEFSQEEFINEISGVPLVLMPLDEKNVNLSASLDGITNAYRYYKVYEYIYNNYVPLCMCENEYAIWCLADRYEDYSAKITDFKESITIENVNISNELKAFYAEYDFDPEALDLIEYGYDGPYEETDNEGNTVYRYISVLHYSMIGELAKIWAEKDVMNAIENTELANLSNVDGYYVFEPDSITDKDNGNYLKITATYLGYDTNGNFRDDDESISIDVYFGVKDGDDYIEKYCYQITVKEGTHDYLIRCSTDYFWYTNEVNAVYIDPEYKVYVDSMTILEGD